MYKYNIVFMMSRSFVDFSLGKLNRNKHMLKTGEMSMPDKRCIYCDTDNDLYESDIIPDAIAAYRSHSY